MDNEAHQVHYIFVSPLDDVVSAGKGSREGSARRTVHTLEEPPLRDFELSVLLSADEDGRINIPCGSASEIEEFRLTLLRLEKKGLVSRCEGVAFYRPFILTTSGVSARSLSQCNLAALPATPRRKK